MALSVNKRWDDLRTTLTALRKLDKSNQASYFDQIINRKRPLVTRQQLHVITEGLFLAAFRSYEQFVRQVFLSYCTGEQPSKRKLVRCFLQPRSRRHAEELMQSAMPHLDWSSPDTVRNRAEIYLKDGFPIKQAIEIKLEQLRDLRKIRNHVAHRSPESLDDYLKVMIKHYSVRPLRLPDPGEYLLETVRNAPNKQYLQLYFDLIEQTAKQMI